MNGKNAVWDSNVIIFASKEVLDTELILANYDAFYVSVITQMEVYGYAFSQEAEKNKIDALFEGLTVVHTDEAISERVIAYRSAHKIKLPDAIILATARVLYADLVTDNVSDFEGIDPAVNIIPLRTYMNRSDT